MGIKRHEAGIFPAERAVMAFNGELYHVGFDNIQTLKHWGPDVIFIEKEGLVEKLLPFTTSLGIALVHSQGFHSEYAEMLANEVIRWGGNAGILTDFDGNGITIGLKIRGPVKDEKINARVNGTIIKVDTAFYRQHIPKRLGIDYETLQYLGIPISKVQENALDKNGDPSKHWAGLYNTLQGKRKGNNSDEWTSEQLRDYSPYLLNNKVDGQTSYLDFLKNWRVELDSVINISGAQKFWDWLEKRILETFETRDYNRAFTIPRYVLTPTMLRFENKISKRSSKVIEKPRLEEAEKLRTVHDLLDVNKKENQISKYLLKNFVLKDPKIKKIDIALKTLMKEQKF